MKSTASVIWAARTTPPLVFEHFFAECGPFVRQLSDQSRYQLQRLPSQFPVCRDEIRGRIGAVLGLDEKVRHCGERINRIVRENDGFTGACRRARVYFGGQDLLCCQHVTGTRPEQFCQLAG